MFRVVLVAALICLAQRSDAASPDICRGYARDYTQIVITRVWLRSYTACLNSDTPPEIPSDWQEALKRIIPDDTCVAESPPRGGVDRNDQEGIVPATGKPSMVHQPGQSTAAAAAKPVSAAAVPTPPEQFCARAHRKISWSGKSWRCL